MKTNCRKFEPKIVYYRNYKNFTNEFARENMVNRLSVTEINTNDRGFEKFFKIYGDAHFAKEEIYYRQETNYQS